MMSEGLGGIGARTNNRQGPRAEEETARPGEIDHLKRARERVAQIRARYGDDDEIAEVYLDRWYAEAPPGWTYEWKTHSVWNKEYPQYMNALLRTGWSSVPASRHRDLVHPGYNSDDAIIIEGMILMERPKELTDRQRRRDYLKALDIVRTSEMRLADAPPGTAPRASHAMTMPRVGSHVGPVIPD